MPCVAFPSSVLTIVGCLKIVSQVCERLKERHIDRWMLIAWGTLKIQSFEETSEWTQLLLRLIIFKHNLVMKYFWATLTCWKSCLLLNCFRCLCLNLKIVCSQPTAYWERFERQIFHTSRPPAQNSQIPQQTAVDRSDLRQTASAAANWIPSWLLIPHQTYLDDSALIFVSTCNWLTVQSE